MTICLGIINVLERPEIDTAAVTHRSDTGVNVPRNLPDVLRAAASQPSRDRVTLVMMNEMIQFTPRAKS
jgi:L-asparaginase/Glu-tRNA(Gln) amidotransferase subunit D